MPTYSSICSEIKSHGPYMTDPIGKCLREKNAFSKQGPSRADKYLLASATYAAAKAHRNLKVEFDPSRAEKGYLVWKESRKFGTMAHFPIEVDERAGIVRQLDREAYGMLSDVRSCLHRKASDAQFVPWRLATADREAPTWIEPTQEEIDTHNPDKSKFGTNGRPGRIQHPDWTRRVAKLWKNKCAVTGCKNSSLLDAAHILPHRDGTTAERLDPENGIYLATHLHKAFDRGLISFSDDGRLLFSPSFDPEDRKTLGIPDTARLSSLPQQTKKYLQKHRKHHGFT
jgi:hypothetical protein